MNFNQLIVNTIVGLISLSLVQGQNNSLPRVDLSGLKPNVNKLIAALDNNSTIIWDRLAEMTDLYGHRLTGSKGLEDSIAWVTKKMEEDGLDVYKQTIKAEYWVRGKESLYLHSPTRGRLQLEILGLGRTVGTPEGGITAEVVSVSSWDQHKALGETDKLRGKIVLCNFRWTTYGAGSTARAFCSQRSEAYGAVATLVRSVTPFSLNTLHTGGMYKSKIPGATITVEDAEYLARLEERAKRATPENAHIFAPPKVELHLGACNRVNQAITRNIIAELKGREKPEEIIIMSGHLDSWDIGVGAADDGAGAFIGWEALRQIAKLPERPRRTIRSILWTNEELGTAGGEAYFKMNKYSLENHILAMESDYGNFDPYGLAFNGIPEAVNVMQAISDQLLANTTYGKLLKGAIGITDIGSLCESGVPCAGITTNDRFFNITANDPKYQNGNYFVYHHTKGDRMEALIPRDLAKCAATAAVYAYSVAELEQTLPKQIKVPRSA